jgi:signal transduction histidine kinase/DNA-binding response OmpR family regulator/HPt (histidine-containing phosphotransfer) domain-containing protein
MNRFLSLLSALILLLFGLQSFSKKAESLILNDNYKSSLYNCVEIYVDTTRSFSINDIISIESKFELPVYKNEEIFIGFSQYNHWLKFELKNDHDKARTAILEIQNPLIHELELFSIVDNKIEKYRKTGTAYKFGTRQINNRFFAYEILLDPNKSYQFFLKIYNDLNTTNLPINLYIPSEYNKQLANKNIVHGLFYGIIITILLSTFLLLFINRNEKRIKYYLWFFAYVLLFGMYNLISDGYAFQHFWPDFPELNKIFIIVFPSLGFYFLSMFTSDFFELRNNNRLLHKIILSLGYLTLSTIILLFFKNIGLNIITPFLITIVILLNLAIIYASISIFSKVARLSIYFITAYFIMLIVLFSVVSYVLGFGLPIDQNTFIIKTGTIIQFIILTIALTAKMKIQQDLVYNKSITNLQEAKDLKERLYAELEKKVDERTLELTTTKNKIEEANQLIQNKNQDLEKAFKKSSNHYIKLQKALRTINEQNENLEKANKEIQESSRLKEIFLANTSHEIRTPLNAIVGFTNLLLKSSPSNQQLKYISNIKASGENLLVVINDILDFSKIEAGKLTFEETDFNIFELFDHIHETFRVKADEKSILLENKSDESISPFVCGDPVRLNQILINIVGNAIKFTPKNGKVSFGFSKITQNEEKVHLAFFVEDTGIGISEENLTNIFESFTQAESETTRKYGGTGLGLSIVKQLIELQKGKISVQSKINEGTRFDFDLEYKIGKESPTVQISKKTIEYSDCLQQNLKILIVEDNEVNQQLATDTIKLWNNSIEIEIAQNGNIAIQKSYEKKYDLILMDIQMPQMDGFETTSVIRKEKDSLNNKTPIVAMTAHAMKDEKENCIAVGMNDYISKPFDPDELFGKIKTYSCKKVVRLIEKGENIDYSTIICDKNDCEDYSKIKKTQTDKKQVSQDLRTNNFIHINLEYLTKLYQGDTDKIKKILVMYLESIPNDLESLKTAEAKTDWKTMEVKAHSLKPKLNYIGLLMASEYAKQVERFAKNNEQFAIIKENIHKINDEWNLASQEITAFLKK